MDKEPSKFEIFLEQKGFLTIHQLVQYLAHDHPERSISFPTVQRYIHKGIFRCTKVGGQYRIERPEIDWFVKYGTDGIERAREPSLLPPDITKSEPTERSGPPIAPPTLE